MSRPTSHARGATLIEVILTIGISSILLAATVSMFFVAQRAVACNAPAEASLSQESAVMQMITTDVNLATSFTERTTRSITMVVPDRTGDGTPETIRYAWSGTAGDPLTRQMNGGTAVTIAANCHRFNLTYLVKTLTGGN